MDGLNICKSQRVIFCAAPSTLLTRTIVTPMAVVGCGFHWHLRACLFFFLQYIPKKLMQLVSLNMTEMVHQESWKKPFILGSKR